AGAVATVAGSAWVALTGRTVGAVVRPHGTPPALVRREIAVLSAQDTCGGEGRVVDVLRVGCAAVLGGAVGPPLPVFGQEAQGPEFAVPRRVAVEPAVVGVGDLPASLSPVERGPDDRFDGTAVRTDGRAGSALSVPGLHVSDGGQCAPRQVTVRFSATEPHLG